MSYPMSDVRGTLKLSHTSQGTTEVKFLNIDISQELTEKLNDIRFVTSYPGYDDYPLSSTVELWLGRTQDVAKVFSGILVSKEVREEGKYKYEEFLAKQLPDFEINLITLSATTDSITTHIKNIVKPLTDAGVITVNSVDTMSSQVRNDKLHKDEIFTSLRKFCKDNTVDSYIDLTDDLHAFHIGDGGASSMSLDQTDLNNPMILDILYKEDLERVRNTVTVLGAMGSILPSGSLDYKTETSGDLGTWVGEWNNGSSWDTNLDKELTDELTTGTACVHIYKDHDDEFGMAVKKIRGSVDLTNMDLSNGASLSISLKENNKSPSNFTDMLMHAVMSDKEIRIHLIDTANNTITHDAMIPNNRIVTWDIPIKDRTWYTGTLSTIQTWNDTVSSMMIEIVYRGQDKNEEWFGRGRQRGDLYIDGLHFITRYKAEYEDTISSSSFGLRELSTDKIYYDELISNGLCVARASRLIDYISTPEEYPSEITLDGNKDFELGKELPVKTDKVDGTFTIRRMEHRVDEDLNWKTVLGLSGSEYVEPKTSREKLLVNTRERIKELERKISEIDTTFYDRYGGASDSISPISTLKWDNIIFDWDTIFGSWTTVAIDRFFTSWDNVVDGLGGMGTYALSLAFESWNTIADALGSMGTYTIGKVIDSWTDFATAVGPTAITTTGSIANNAINLLSQITDGLFSIAGGGRNKFEELFVGTAMIDTLAVTEAKIGNLAVTTAKIDDLSVNTAKIGSLAVTTAKIDSLAVTEAKIGDLAVTTAKIDDLAVDTAKIASLAVGTGQIDSLAVTEAKIDDLAVTTGKIASLAVTTAKIDNAAITTAKIDTLAVDTAQIVDAAITTAKINDAAIITAKIDDAAITNLKIGSGELTFDRSATSWFREAHFSKGILRAGAEALVGYSGFLASTTDDGTVIISSGVINLKSGTSGGEAIWYSPLGNMVASFSPRFKCKIKKTFSSGTTCDVGISAAFEEPAMEFLLKDDGTIYSWIRGDTQPLLAYSGNEYFILGADYLFEDRIIFSVNQVPRYTFDGFQLNANTLLSAEPWAEEGSSPYLDAKDYDTNYILTITAEPTGTYGFEDVPFGGMDETGTIETLLLINCWCTGAGGKPGSVTVYDGSTWSSWYPMTFPYSATDYSEYQTIDVTSFLSTKTKTNAVRIQMLNFYGGYYYYIDHVYLKVKCTPALFKGEVQGFFSKNAGLTGSVNEFKIYNYSALEEWM